MRSPDRYIPANMNALAPISFASAYRQLTATEKLFVDRYVANVERDAQRAGERISNALYRPIDPDAVQASRGLLEKPMVRASIVERINTLAAESELSPAKVIKEYASLAFSNVMDIQTVGEDGMPSYDLAKATPEHCAAIAGVKYKETFGPRGPVRELEVRYHPKQPALDALAKYMGLLEANNPHWRSETARPINADVLPASLDDAGAADAYSLLING